VNVPAGRVLLSSSHRTDRGGSAFSLADGRTGPGVSGVILSLDDGTNVQATVGGGWFVAWWPSGHEQRPLAMTIWFACALCAEPGSLWLRLSRSPLL
jgi:hypothetical protein